MIANSSHILATYLLSYLLTNLPISLLNIFPRLIPHSKLVPQCGTILKTTLIYSSNFISSRTPSISTECHFASPGFQYGKLSCKDDNFIDRIRVVTRQPQIATCIGVARGGQGRAFALPLLHFSLPSKPSSYLNCIQRFFYNLLRVVVPAHRLLMKGDYLGACHVI